MLEQTASFEASATWEATSYQNGQNLSFWTKQSLAATTSVRIFAGQGMSERGEGSEDSPVLLRSQDFHQSANTPYEWFLRFTLPGVGSALSFENATLRLTKCTACDGCKSSCVGCSARQLR